MSNISKVVLHFCIDFEVSASISHILLGVRISLFIPLSILILSLGYHQWRLHHSFAATSNIDFLTFHLALTQLIAAVGSIVYFGGSVANQLVWTEVGIYTSAIVFPAETYFHILTCVDRYLAVVHPVFYMRLKSSSGATIRNVAGGCLWLLCFGWIGVATLYSPDLPRIPFLCSLTFSLAVISSCTLAVLCTLIRPGPGEAGGNRKRRADQSKRRAFRTISYITAVVLLYFVGTVVSMIVESVEALARSEACIMLLLMNWIGLPSSLVLPLLFLHKTGKVPCCRGNIEQTLK